MNVYIYIYIYIFWQHFFISSNFVEYNRYFLSTYFLVDPFKLPYWFCSIRRELIDIFSLIVYFPSKKHSRPTTELWKILTENTTILEHENDKQKLQSFEALHIRNMQPKLNRIHFQTSANILKCF